MKTRQAKQRETTQQQPTTMDQVNSAATRIIEDRGFHYALLDLNAIVSNLQREGANAFLDGDLRRVEACTINLRQAKAVLKEVEVRLMRKPITVN